MRVVIMELKITTLIENEEDNQGNLTCEHGLSLYIEFQGKRILFDTGQTVAFLDNANKMGIDVTAVDYCIVSHGHYDHSGGMERLGEGLSNPLPLYVGKDFFVNKYKKLDTGMYKYNGNPFTKKQLLQYPFELTEVEADVTYLEDNVILFRNFASQTTYELPNQRFVRGEEYVCDSFVDEVALGLLTSKGLVVVVGCSHVGVVNILKTIQERINVPIYGVLGGTHLVEADVVRLRETASALREMGIQQIAVSHCTGEDGKAYMKAQFGEAFIRNNTGNVYTV